MHYKSESNQIENHFTNLDPQMDFLNRTINSYKILVYWFFFCFSKAISTKIVFFFHQDDLEPVDELVKHSSSAVDIKTVLIQIKTFWQQLDWPDTEASYAFISKILDVRYTSSHILVTSLSHIFKSLFYFN